MSFMTELTKHPRVAIDELIRELHLLPASAFEGTEEVRSLLAKRPVEEASLAPYLTWDGQHYTRNLIDKTQLYEVMAICWEVGQCSSVHNHRNQHCWMAAPVGRLLVNPCAVDPQEPVHRVVNPREANQRAVSLHVYSRPFDTCVVYSPEQGTCGDIRLHYNTVFGKPAPRGQ
jgi:hypothetical protein